MKDPKPEPTREELIAAEMQKKGVEAFDALLAAGPEAVEKWRNGMDAEQAVAESAIDDFGTTRYEREASLARLEALDKAGETPEETDKILASEFGEDELDALCASAKRFGHRIKVIKPQVQHKKEAEAKARLW
jgi:hypothetical protein